MSCNMLVVYPETFDIDFQDDFIFISFIHILDENIGPCKSTIRIPFSMFDFDSGHLYDVVKMFTFNSVEVK